MKVLDPDTTVAEPVMDGGKVAKHRFRLSSLLVYLMEMQRRDALTLYEMKCPWTGESPVVEVNQGPFAGAGFRMEFSLEFCSKFFRHELEQTDGGVP